MNRNAILNAMEKVAKEIYEDSAEYRRTGQRGMMVVQIRDKNNPSQWDSTCRNFGTVFRDYQYEDELVISNGTNFDALVHGKIAYCRRTGFNSGTNYYQVLGYESYWKGAILSEDNNCICAYAGFTGNDDAEIARAGIICYESLLRTGKSLKTGGDPEYEEPDSPESETSEDGTSETAGEDEADDESVDNAPAKKTGKTRGRPKKLP